MVLFQRLHGPGASQTVVLQIRNNGLQDFLDPVNDLLGLGSSADTKLTVVGNGILEDFLLELQGQTVVTAKPKKFPKKAVLAAAAAVAVAAVIAEEMGTSVDAIRIVSMKKL